MLEAAALEEDDREEVRISIPGQTDVQINVLDDVRTTQANP